VRPQGSLNAAAAGATTLPTIVVAVSGRRRGEGGQKVGVSSRLPAPKSAPARLSPEQEKLGPGWNHAVQGSRVVKAQATKEPAPNPSCAGGHTRGWDAPADGQPKPCRRGAPVVGPQPPQPQHTDSSPPHPNHRVSHHSRGSPIPSTNIPQRPAYSRHAVCTPRPHTTQQGTLPANRPQNRQQTR
jgi:hypothetical protein